MKVPNLRTQSESSGDGWSRPSPRCTFLCRRKFDTTEKWRPQPSTSQANAVFMSVKITNNCVQSELTLLASVAIHVRLQRAGSRKALVADLTLVLLLRARGDLRAELAHHGLRRGRESATVQAVGSGQRARRGHILAGGAVVADRCFGDRAVVVARVGARGRY